MPSRAPRRPIVLLCTLAVAAVASAAAGDWARFRGPEGLGVSTDAGLPVSWSEEENVVWKAELPGPGTSSPAILGERIFLTCYTGYAVPGQPRGAMDDLKRHVVCLHRDGKILWTKAVASVLPDSPRIRENHGYASSTPVAEAGRLYVFFGKSGVFAFDHDGKQLWHADVGEGTSGWGSAASPILVGDTLIVNASVESRSLIALDKATGKERWRAGGIKESWNTPILVTTRDGKTELAVAIFGKVLGFDPATGERLWSCDTDIGWYMVPSLVTCDGIVYCIGGRGKGGALAVRAGGRGDVTASHRLWAIQKGSNVPSPVYHGGRLYWVHESGTACCADAKTGRIVYEQRLPRAAQVYASPVLADGRLIVLSRWGRGWVLAAKPAFEVLATNELGRVGMTNASPALAAGRLYLRSDRFLFCIGK